MSALRLAVVLAAGLLMGWAPESSVPSTPGTVGSAWSGRGHCLAFERSTVAAMTRRMEQIAAASPLVDAQAGGLRLIRQPRVLVEALRDLSAGAPAASQAASRCQTVFCGVAELYGEELGVRLLYLDVRYGYNAAAEGLAGDKGWTAAELDEVIAALGDLPRDLLPLGQRHGRPMVRDEHGLSEFASRAWGEALAVSGPRDLGIRLGRRWRAAPAAERRASLVHEVAHDFSRQRGRAFNWADAWRAAMARDAEMQARLLHPPGPLSLYARTNLDEDFAESATAYRYMPEALKRAAPARYEFLRVWMFDGLEYDAAGKCAPAAATSDIVRRETLRRLTDLRIDQPLRDAVLRRCRRALEDSEGGAMDANWTSCALRGLFATIYAEVWNARSASRDGAGDQALDEALRNPALVDRALAQVDPALRRSLIAGMRVRLVAGAPD